MKKTLITGITGFAGSWLADYLSHQEQTEIFGTYLSEKTQTHTISVARKVHLFRCNLLEKKSVSDLIKKEKPTHIYHLAALASPALSFQEPETVLMNNITAQLYVFEAVRSAALFNTKILIVSSADVYGKVEKIDLPIDEGTRLQPTNPYAVSKIAQDFLGYQYYLSYGLPIVRVRPFNHIGPRQSADFVVSAFARQIAEIEKGKRENTLRVGDLTPRRDFTDVRDMVRAYACALESCTPGEVYNIGSGFSLSIKEILEKLLSFSRTAITVEADQALLRPSNTPDLICDASKFTSTTHWRPQMSIDQTLKDTLDYWRRIV